MRKVGLLVLCLGVPAVGHAETDVFLQAIGFALTGSDNTKVTVVDRKNCVFRVDYHDVFHLNNVHVDRIVFEPWVQRDRINGERRYLKIKLHGSDTVLERNARVDESKMSAENLRALRQIDPNAFKDSVTSFNETTLELDTAETDRVKRAWTYIYSNGCVGKKSPF
jgi:hypothetical protein